MLIHHPLPDLLDDDYRILAEIAILRLRELRLSVVAGDR